MTSDPDAAARWRDDRRAAAQAHADALESRRLAESARARELIAAFVQEATVHGPAPVELRARSYDGRSRFRTPLRGWYLRRDESLAVDVDGAFYVLTAPSSLGARFRGVTPAPSDPPLVLGAGGKDGESLDLVQALDRVLHG
ncbi:hypothetical protein Cch01nite_30510 [Cellulomonas chitinilytica]|uniref:Uncharacterized protein n=1 Tax=Cellulomonas chitinilytica TaxID=398759 RepID=A0A919U3D0_9CELL|nr:hypothetical protein [Cellulomonas chitinilytica]GIG22327.1 hypothetical protein Cch01nite_30510 [Cellulomonas chitinilytica]